MKKNPIIFGLTFEHLPISLHISFLLKEFIKSNNGNNHLDVLTLLPEMAK